MNEVLYQVYSSNMRVYATTKRTSKRAKENAGPNGDSEIAEGLASQPPWAELQRSIEFKSGEIMDKMQVQHDSFAQKFSEYKVKMEAETTRLNAKLSSALDRIAAR